MIRTLQSSWFVALIGALLYLGTTVFILSPAKFAGAKFARQVYTPGNDPSWRFRDPQLTEWLAQIRSKKESLDQREQNLNELQTRLNVELQEISTITQTVYQLQQKFDQNVIHLKAAQEDNVKRQAKLVSAMSPEGAMATLGQMPDDDVVRILYTMKADQASAILDAMSKSGEEGAKRAALLTEKLHQVLPVASSLPTPTP
jgi:flagellar motility protein MotE (MotC chaperone)